MATDHLEPLPDGRLLYHLRHRWRDGTTQIVFEPHQLLGRLVHLIPAPRAPEKTSIEAEYSLESPLTCGECHKQISTINVVRLLRGKVNFTSTLPRKGYVMLCPECQTILSANLGGI